MHSFDSCYKAMELGEPAPDGLPDPKKGIMRDGKRTTKGIRKRARVRSELDSAAKEPQIRRRQPEATRKGNEEERTTRSHEYNKQ